MKKVFGIAAVAAAPFAANAQTTLQDTGSAGVAVTLKLAAELTGYATLTLKSTKGSGTGTSSTESIGIYDYSSTALNGQAHRFEKISDGLGAFFNFTVETEYSGYTSVDIDIDLTTTTSNPGVESQTFAKCGAPSTAFVESDQYAATNGSTTMSQFSAASDTGLTNAGAAGPVNCFTGAAANAGTAWGAPVTAGIFFDDSSGSGVVTGTFKFTFTGT
jgi:hypothetical protein